jgi:hypothetical protein
MKYVATIHVPGYLPMDDDPPTFDTPAEAWQYLADEREHGEGRWVLDDPDDPDGTASEDPTYACLTHAAEATSSYVCGNDSMHRPDQTGTIYGTTPGYDPEDGHDLGMAYTVEETDDNEIEE